MGDQSAVGSMSGEVAPLTESQNRNAGGENSDPSVGAVGECVAAKGSNGNGNGSNGDGGTEEGRIGDAANGGGHPVPDNLSIIANGMTKANGSAGNGGNGNDGEGDNVAGEVGSTAEESGRPPIDTACSDGGPSSLVGMVGPPSPLTGCYLLIVLGEPHSEEHKEHILKKLLKGFLSWDVSDCHVDLEEELNTITQQAPEGEEARYGERLIQYASENLVTEVLIHPQYNTLIQCMRNLLSSFTRHRHVIHAGYTFTGNGSWILQDGTFSVADFSEAFQEHDVQRVLRAYPDTISMNIHCADNGLWNSLPDKAFAKMCKICINPNDVLETSNASINAFIDYLTPMLATASLSELLETSDVVGNIRFTHPTLYVFPGGQGDAALFGINGFNMLVDGGFNRKACFWDFARHLDRLDAVLLTRINNSNINGMAAVVERKRVSHVYPHIGHFFCNIPDRKALPSPDGDKDKDPLLVDLFERGHSLVNDLKNLDLKPQTCYRNPEPINLYHKVGHGTLDMYVISPSRDSKEVKEFMQKWNAGDQRLFAARDSREFNFPLYNLVSICALLVWQPADPDDTITRILFPGSTPDYKIQEGLEKLKHLEFMKYSTCTAKSIAPVIQTTTTRRIYKSGPLEKGIVEPVLPSKVAKSERDANLIETRTKTTVQQQPDNKSKEAVVETIDKKIENIIDKSEDILDLEVSEHVSQKLEPEPDAKGNIENENEEENNKETLEKRKEIMIVKPQQQIIESNIKDESLEIVKPKPKTKAEKPRAEVKPVIRSRIDTKPPKSMEKKGLKKEDRKISPTPVSRKHDISIKPQPTKEKDIKPRIISRVAKSSPSSTPAKSTKDANNRKVLESKKHMAKITISRREVTKTSSSTEKRDAKKNERKPISRRPRGTSPSKRAPGSPVKLPRPRTELRKSRLDKGGTTDSSLVSTPSADEVPTAKKIQDMVIAQELDAAKQRELDDLKEEQEVVREIEAVFSRDEKKRKGELRSGHREILKQDSTTEAEEDEEYLIIEKEELEQYTEDSMVEQESSITKEEEIQKHQRDSQESEKKRKRSAEEEIEAEIAKAEAEERRNRQQAEAEETEDDDDIQPDSIDEKLELTTPEKCELKAEVQEIISSAKEIAKARTEETEVKTEELSSPSPEEKISSAKKTADTKDDPLDAQDAVKDINLQESLPEEKFSATIESGATTAPTLPEDERIPLDEIKEDHVIEEKHIKEETKETTASVLQKKTTDLVEGATIPAERVLPLKMTFETQSNLMRDVVKTPDEVADLPVHEEADFGVYDEKEIQDSSKLLSLKEEIAKEEKEVEEKASITQEAKIFEKNTELEQEILQIDLKKSEIEKTGKSVNIAEGKQPEKLNELSKTEVTVKDIMEVKDVQIAHDTLAFAVESTVRPKIAEELEQVAKETVSPDEKELSEITSEGDVPLHSPAMRAKITTIRDKDDNTSLESPATIEEAIEVEIAKTTLSKKNASTEKEKETYLGKSLLEELQVESEKLELESKRLRLKTEELHKANDKPAALKTTELEHEIEKNKKDISTLKESSMDEIKSKETSRPESKLNQAEEQEKERKESVDKVDKISPVETDLKLTEKSLEKISPAESQKGGQSKPASKEASRPESVASHEESKPGSGKDEKSLPSSKEPSRPESKLSQAEELEKEKRESEADLDKAKPDTILPAEILTKISPAESQKDEKSEPASMHASRPESVASHEESKPGSVKDDKSPQSSKEISRPESKLSQAEEEETERRESEAEADKISPVETDLKLTEKSLEKISPAGSQKGGQSEPASKEASRPESVVSHEESKPGSGKDEKSLPSSKEPSRPESKLSQAAELEKEKRESEADLDKAKPDTILPAEILTKISPAESQKDEKSEPASMHASRPESVASHEESKPGSIRDDKSPQSSKEISRPESKLSQAEEEETERRESEAEADKISPVETDLKLTEKSLEKISPAGSQKGGQSEPASKEASRPESVVSHEESKAGSGKDEKSLPSSKEPSRPESKLSQAEELEKERRESEADLDKAKPDTMLPAEILTKISPAESQKDEKSEPASMHASRPESVASHEESKPGSVRDDKSPQSSKEISRPESKLSQAEEEETERRESEAEADKISPVETDLKLTEKSLEKISPAGSQKGGQSEPASKEASRPESVVSHEESKAGSGKDEKSLPSSKEPSRPESKLSQAEELEKERRESEADLDKAKPDTMLPAEILTKISPAESQKDEKSEPESMHKSRPESVASHEESKPGSVKDDKSPQSSKETSRPESKLSQAEEEETERRESEAEADKTSPVETDLKLTEKSIEKISPTESQKVGQSEPASKEASRPETVASHEESKPGSVKDEKSPPSSKEPSRPESKLSQAEELEKERRESETDLNKAEIDTKLSAEILTKISPAERQKDDKSEPAMHASRPESVASHEESKPGSVKDDKSPQSSKETSRPESKLSQAEEEETERKESEAEADKTSPVETDLKLTEKSIEKISPTKSLKGGQSEPASKEASRPETVASHEELKPESVKDDKSPQSSKETSRPESKLSQAEEEETERRESEAEADKTLPGETDLTLTEKSIEKISPTESQKVGQSEPASKEAIRPETVASHEESKPGSVKDEKSPPSSKESSRPESKLSQAEELEKERRESETDLNKAEIDTKLSAEILTKISPAESQKDEKSEPSSTHVSRPESVASHEESRPGSVKDDKSPPSSKETSRPESKLTQAEGEETERRESEAEADKTSPVETDLKLTKKSIEKISPTESLKVGQSEPASKEASRPESLASHEEYKPGSVLDDKSCQAKEKERRESEAEADKTSTVETDLKLTEKSIEKISPTESQKGGQSEPASKEPSRPESVASHEESKPGSVKDEKSPPSSKEPSRPEPKLSQAEELEKERRESEADLNKAETDTKLSAEILTKISPVESQKDEKSEPAPKHTSRPESVASHEESKPGSVNDDKSPQSLKETSRPESKLSQAEEQEKERKESVDKVDKISPAETDLKLTEKSFENISPAESQKGGPSGPGSKEASRPESVASHEESKPGSVKDEKSLPSSKEPSRPESKLSQAEELEKERRESEADLDKAKPDTILPAEILTKISPIESQKDEKSEPPSMHASRPESVASHEESKPGSLKDDKSPQSSKETSRPESKLSQAEEQEIERRESGAELDKAESDAKLPAELLTKISPAGSQKDEKSEPASKQASRPESIASHEESKSESVKDDKSPPSSKDISRPESKLSQAEELEKERRESEVGLTKAETDIKLSAEILTKISPAESQKDEKSEPASMHASRPESVASHEESKPISVKDDKSPMSSSRPESVASHEESKPGSVKDEKSPPSSKEPSRPESKLSQAEELEKERRESEVGLSKAETDTKLSAEILTKISPAESQKDEKSEPASMHASRPESVASHEESKPISVKDDKSPTCSSRPESVASHEESKPGSIKDEKSPPSSKEPTRPESKLSQAEELEKERRESEVGLTKAETDTKLSAEILTKISPAESQKDEKSEPASMHASRPESVASHEESKPISIKDDKSPTSSKETSRPESKLSQAEELEKEHRELEADLNKTETDTKLSAEILTKISPAESHKDEKSEPASKQASRTESIVSHEESKPGSVKDDKSPPSSKDTSRPESKLGKAEELEIERRESETELDKAESDANLSAEISTKISQAESQKDEKSEPASKEASRPESVASHEDSKHGSLKDEKSEPASKQASSPESIAGHEESKPGSVKDDKSPPSSKDTSRPESKLGKAEELEIERRESETELDKAESDANLSAEISTKISQAESQKDEKSEPASKEASRPESVASHEDSKHGSLKDEKSEPASKQASSPESIAGHEESKSGSGKGEKSPPSSKVPSRPESKLGKAEELEIERRELEAELEKAESDAKLPAELLTKISPAESQKDEKSEPASKQASRPESIASREESKPGSVKDDKSPPSSKEPSRPESKLSHAEELEKERRDSEAGLNKAETDTKLSAEILTKISSADSQKDQKSEPASMHASRPESETSHDESKPGSVNDDKSPQSLKETSRPESKMSQADEQEKERKESVDKVDKISPAETDLKLTEKSFEKISPAESQKGGQSEPGSKEASRPESVASHEESKPGSVKDEKSLPSSKEPSRPESKLSQAEELEKERRESEADLDKAKPDTILPAEILTKISPTESQKDEKSEPPSMHASRPESVASHEESKPGSLKDDKSPQSSKETSRPESKLSQAEEQEIERRESGAELDKAESDAKLPAELLTKISPAGSQKDEKSEPASKQASRPESIASHEESKSESVKDDKSPPSSKDISRPESKLGKAEEQEIERRESGAELDKAESDAKLPAELFTKSSPAESQKDEKSEPASKEASRPESVASHEESKPSSLKDEKSEPAFKQASRPESVASHEDFKPGSLKDEKSEPASKEASRPGSVASHEDSKPLSLKDDKSEPALKPASRPESVASHEESKPGSVKDEKSPPSSKESSQSESKLSQAEELVKERRESEADLDKAKPDTIVPAEILTKISPAESQKDEKSEPASMHASRPESVASHEKSKPGSVKDDKSPQSSKETSRPESKLSQAEQQEIERRESGAELDKAESDAKLPTELLTKISPGGSQKDEKSEPESVASHEKSKPGSVKDDKSPQSSKETSRPESKLSQAEELEKERRESETDLNKAEIDTKLSAEILTKISPAERQKDEKSEPASKQASRPESIASHEESKPGSVKDDKSPPSSKDISRPESKLGKAEEQEIERRESGAELDKAESDAKLPAVFLTKISPAGSQKDEKSEPSSKQASRPESIASHEESKSESVKDDKSPPSSKDISRPESKLGKAEEQEIERRESGAELDKAESDAKLPAELLTKIFPAESQKDEKSEPASKQASRPESIASHEESKPGSVKDDKSPPSSKDISRPESKMGKAEEQEIERRESGAELDKAESDAKLPAELLTKISPAGSQKDEKSEPASKQASRPKSITSHEESKSEGVKDDKSHPSSKESSRPESKLGKAEELEIEHRELEADLNKTVTDTKLSAEILTKISPAESQKDAKSEPASKEASRPESVASHEDSKPSSLRDEKSELASKEASRPESVASHEDSKPVSLKDEKSEPASKEASRPDSVASHEYSKPSSLKDEKSEPASKEASRPESVASHEDSKPSSLKDEKSEPASKQASRPEPVASHEDFKPGSLKDGKSEPASKEASRSGSVASHEDSKPVSLKDEKSEPASKQASRRESVASHEDSKPSSLKDEKSEPASSQASRPESVASHEDYKPGSLKDEKFEPASKEVSRPEFVVGLEESKPGCVKDEKSSPSSKETSLPESKLSQAEKQMIERREPEAKADKISHTETDSKLTEKSIEKISPAEGQKDGQSEPALKQESRPESMASHEDSKPASLKDEKSEPASKQASRPESVASYEDYKHGSLKDEKSGPASKEASRPESVASHEDSEHGSLKDEKLPPSSKDSSQPESKLCQAEVLTKQLRDSKAEPDKEGKKISPTESHEDEKHEPASKETSRPESVASHEDTSRAESVQISDLLFYAEQLEKYRQETEPGAIKAEMKSSEPISSRVDVKCERTTKFPVISGQESKFPNPQQDDITKVSFTDVRKTISSSKPFDDSKEETSEQKLETFVQTTDEKSISADTSSYLVDKDLVALAAEKVQYTSKSDKDSFKIDLKQKDVIAESSVLTASSPIDEAEFQILRASSQIVDNTGISVANAVPKAAENAKVLKDTVSSPIDEVTPLVETEQNMEEVFESLTTSFSEATVKAVETISSFKDDLKNMALKVETIAEDSSTALLTEIAPIPEKIEIVTEQSETSIVSETIESVKISYDVQSFHTELRETHITTIDSPAREEIVLHDIKEEDEEHRFSPPRETTSTKSVNIAVDQPKRPVSPREEEVAKIVANVAEVLKSEKDITEIIPDFDEKVLEEKLLQTKEDGTAVQRMLVTASSEDGGEEIEICPKGSILFTPSSTPEAIVEKISPDASKSDEKPLRSQPDSEKSSPDLKSGPISLEEKDKIEISEKAQIEKASFASTGRKESSCSINENESELRRGSAVSTLSEKDITRDESTYDERPDSAASLDLGRLSPENADQTKATVSVAQEFHSETDKVEKTSTQKDSFTTVVESKKTTSSQSVTKDQESIETHFDINTIKLDSTVSSSDKDISKTYSEKKGTKTSILPEDCITSQHLTFTEIEENAKCAEKSNVKITSQFSDSSTVASTESRSSHTKEDLSADLEESLRAQWDQSSGIYSTTSKAKGSETQMKESVTIHSDKTEGSQSKVSSSVFCRTTSLSGSDSKSQSKFIGIEKSPLSKYSEDSSSFVEINANKQIHTETTEAEEKRTRSEQKMESSEHTKDSLRRESTRSQSGEFHHVSSLSDQEDEDEDNSENLRIKESRSKSIATIMMTSIYKPSDDSHAFDILEEESVDALAKHSSTSLKSATQSFDIAHKKIAQESKINESKHVMTLEQRSPEEHLDSKTPPTAPVSPGIKSTCTPDQRESVQQSSINAMQYSEMFGVSVPSSPKDVSGKSSPSESRSIPTPAGRDSFTDTPESSPKPTSPFPRMTKEDIHTTTTFGAPEVARTSTPELSEIRALEKTALSGSSEKIITTTITTVTKVISSDGKEIVTEEKTITTTDTSEPTSEKVTVTTTRTTSESDKAPLQPKELATIRSEFRSSTPGSDDDRPFSDDEIPPSPRSITSSQAVSYDLQRSSSGVSKRSDLDIDDSQDDIPPQYGSEEHSSAISISMAHKYIDPMSTSFYGALPESFGLRTTSSVGSTADKSEPIPIRTTRTIVSRTFADSPNSQSSESEGASQTWAVRRSGDHKFLDEADLDFEKALEEHRQVRGAEVMSSVTAKYSYSPSKSEIEETVSKPKFPLGNIQKPKTAESSTTSSTGDESKEQSDPQPRDPLKEWGKPLGLPSPAPIPGENDVRTTPKKERRMVAAKTKLNNEKNLRKRSESPVKTRKSNPVYVDLTYVPHNGNSYYSHVEFFKRVRARYYVFSGTEPSREVYNALLEAKQTWEDKDLEVTIIPTYDTDVLGYWVAENEELLAKYHIDLSPSASRCTINLQDHETSCSAYRLEF